MNKNDNSMAIIILCSHLCVGSGVKPFEPKEWTKLATLLLNSNLEPKDIFAFSVDDFSKILNFNVSEIMRIQELLSRSASIAFELEKYENIGINIVTKADKQYPKKLKKVLGEKCPPLFYYAGNITLSNNKFVGFVGSRNTDSNDELFTQKMVSQITKNKYSVVSGGAKGIDSIAHKTAINNGFVCVEYISDSLIKKIRTKDIINGIRNNQLLMLSVAKPDAGFNAGIAMMRNHLIYAHSEGTVVVKSDYKKGGTWNGAFDNLKKGWCPEFCWDNKSYEGNQALIKNGAIAIDDTWDGNISEYELKKPCTSVQLSFLNQI